MTQEPHNRSPHDDDLPRFTSFLNPLVDLVARIPASVHAKLLAGFLGGTVLLMAMAVVNEVVIGRMNDRAAQGGTVQELLDRSRQMEYLVTSQSHYRAMALLTDDTSNDDKLAAAKQSFVDNLDALDQNAPAGLRGDLAHIRETNDRFTLAGQHVSALELSGQKDAAMQLHLHEEHPISHELESATRNLWVTSTRAMEGGRADINRDRLTLSAVWRVVSIGSLPLALVLGFFFAWAFIRPVRRINRALTSIAGGDFRQRVSVVNRDEFGALADHVNTMTVELERLYGQLSGVSENLQAVVDNALDGIITLDADGIVRTFNPVAQVIFGYTAAEAIGMPVAQLVPELAGSRGVSGGRREVEGCKKDGSTFPIEVAASAMQVRDERGFIVILRDITERKRAQEELALARDLALEASRAKSSFVTNMSHELRTPLNAIIGYSEMLQEEAADLDQQEFVPDLQKIQSAGKHLLELINSVLDLSKIEAGKMELYLETFAVEPVVRDVAALIQPLVQKNANELRVTSPGELGSMHADLTKVRQLLFNLLSNACKFTEHGTVSLESERTTMDGAEWLVFRISDSGIGMTPEQMGKLFQPFTQADASTMRKYGGTGLGLALCQRFSEMMGGEVSVSSELAHGSHFTVRLPAVVAQPVPDITPVALPPVSRPAVESSAEPLPLDAPSVLVIDDDPAARDLIIRGLARERFRVWTATGAQEGVRLARELRPDAITLDVFMPGADGWSVLTALKADPTTADIPVVMITMAQDKNLSYALGATEYLTKPVDRERLTAVVRRIVGKADSKTVLLVDNDPEARQALVRAIEREHWTAVQAANGREALRYVSQQSPDAVLLGLAARDVDGFAFVHALRENPAWRAIPVVVLSATDLTRQERKRLNGTVQAILGKRGLEIDKVIAEIRKLIATSAAPRTSVSV